ncbi:GNAT family N-acetyltransferase [Psychrobium sp. 1_MG-2023]|nr:GNAT family N-acetyltransferase [Psychrobium sp. 1_MG-2023]MDP2559794.1 GNAT family N-acetyltransferase [Psychrobium sp. 1_MG-2023]PKF59168.1 GNAT family N-acetyltransferase [Alteromonadales bacterium alter-6D02]
MQWQVFTFEQLTTHQLYQLLQLRAEVFVVEQTCFYQDLDDKDTVDSTLHLLGYQSDERGQLTLCAYSRVLAPGVSYDGHASIGRVVTKACVRGERVGHELIKESLLLTAKHWPKLQVKISAQTHLQSFYQQHGFNPVSEEYLEDDIPHIAMST